ncbi:hypothetical protein GNG27_09550 [Leclercia sp. 119287]|uniref:hypothetical protein n=1 Tax=Leclercia sp. 119287 TaxID=2681308 RepID=UPI0012E10619|nr:hypothetical protein [Leclercia sp. 119287]QGU14894.1 hypothetical protein GNG27_09550 [Leclercia sp. 119287]
MAGKKIPGAGRGKVHLDYGMMFSGQCENRATLATKHVINTNKYTSNGHVFYQYIQLVTVFVAAHYFLKKMDQKMFAVHFLLNALEALLCAAQM